MARISIFMYVLFSTFGVFSFFLPLYLKHKGFDPGQIGTVIACGSFISMFAQPFWGFVSDKKKTVKRILLLLMCCAFVSSIGVFAVETLPLLMLFFTIFMFFNSASGPLTESLGISYAHQHNKEYGRIRLWGELGVGTSALLLGMIVERVGIGYLQLIYSIGILAAIAVSVILRDTQATPAPVDVKALAQMVKDKRLLWILLVVLIIGIPHRMNDTLLTLYLEQLGTPESLLGAAWLVATLSTVPALLFVGKLIRKWNEIGVMAVAAAAYTVRWLIYWLTDTPVVLIAAQALHMLTFPLFLVATIQYISSIVPAELRATGQAAFAVTFGGLGGIIGSVGGGYAFDLIGAGTSYGLGSALALLGALAAIGTYYYNRRRLVRPAVPGK